MTGSSGANLAAEIVPMDVPIGACSTSPGVFLVLALLGHSQSETRIYERLGRS